MTKKIQDPDFLLIKSSIAGEKSAFNRLILKYQAKILKLVETYIDDRQLALELVQEILLKAYKALPKFKYKSSFYTWLYRIAVNTTIAFLKEQRHKIYEYKVDNYNQVDYLVLKDDPNLNISSIAANELKLKIYLALDGLSAEMKNILLLREINGLSYEEIAEIIYCPIGTVRSRIFRAKEALKHIYQHKLRNNRFTH